MWNYLLNLKTAKIIHIQIRLSPYNTQGSSGKWSWTLDSLKTGHSDTLYLDAGAGWYVSGMKAVLTEAIEIIFALELRNQPNEIEAPVEEQIDKPKREYTPEELSLDFSDFDDLSFAEYLKHSSISSTKKEKHQTIITISFILSLIRVWMAGIS